MHLYKVRLSAMGGIQIHGLQITTKRVDKILAKVQVSDITQINDLIYAGSALVTELIGIRKSSEKQKHPRGKSVYKDKLNI